MQQLIIELDLGFDRHASVANKTVVVIRGQNNSIGNNKYGMAKQGLGLIQAFLQTDLATENKFRTNVSCPTMWNQEEIAVQRFDYLMQPSMGE